MSDVAFYNVNAIFQSKQFFVVPVSSKFFTGQHFSSFLFKSNAAFITRFSPFVKIAGDVIKSNWIAAFNKVFATKNVFNQSIFSINASIKFSLFSVLSMIGFLQNLSWIVQNPRVFSSVDRFLPNVFNVKGRLIDSFVKTVLSIAGYVPANTINLVNHLFASATPFHFSLLKMQGFIRFRWLQSFEVLSNVVNIAWILSTPRMFSTVDRFSSSFFKLRGQLNVNFLSLLKIVSFVDRIQQSASSVFRVLAVSIERFKPLFKINSLVSKINWLVINPKLFYTKNQFITSLLSIQGSIRFTLNSILSMSGFAQNLNWIINSPRLFAAKDAFVRSVFKIKAQFVTDFIDSVLTVFGYVPSNTINLVQKTFAVRDRFVSQIVSFKGFIAFKRSYLMTILADVINTNRILVVPRIFSSRMFPANIHVYDRFKVVAFAIGRWWNLFKISAAFKVRLSQLLRLHGKFQDHFFYIFRVKSSLRDFFDTKIRSRGRAVYSAFNRFRFTGFSIELTRFFFIVQASAKQFNLIPISINAKFADGFKSIYKTSADIVKSFKRRFKLLGFTDSNNVLNHFSVIGFNNLGKRILLFVNANLILLFVEYFRVSSIVSNLFKTPFTVCSSAFNKFSNTFTLSSLLSRDNIKLSFVFATVQNSLMKVLSAIGLTALSDKVYTSMKGSASNRFYFSVSFAGLVKSKFRSFFKITSAVSLNFKTIFRATSNALDFLKCQISITGRSVSSNPFVIAIRSLIATKSSHFLKSIGESIRRRQRSFKILGTKRKLIQKFIRARGIAFAKRSFVFNVRSAIGSLTSMILKILGLSPAVPKEKFSINANVQNDHHIAFYSCRANSKELMYIKLNYNRNQQTYKSQKFFKGKRWFN